MPAWLPAHCTFQHSMALHKPQPGDHKGQLGGAVKHHTTSLAPPTHRTQHARAGLTQEITKASLVAWSNTTTSLYSARWMSASPRSSWGASSNGSLPAKQIMGRASKQGERLGNEGWTASSNGSLSAGPAGTQSLNWGIRAAGFGEMPSSGSLPTTEPAPTTRQQVHRARIHAMPPCLGLLQAAAPAMPAISAHLSTRIALCRSLCIPPSRR